MKLSDEIRIQAYHDGELPSEEIAAVEALLAKDPTARTYLDNLEACSALLSAHSSTPQTDSHEQWAQIEESLDHPQNKAVLFPALAIGIAAALAVGAFAWLQMGAPTEHEHPTEQYYAEVEIIETTYETEAPIVYVDEESGWTVVWVAEEYINDEPLI